MHIRVGMTDVDDDCVFMLMCLFHMRVHECLAIVRGMVIWYMNVWAYALLISRAGLCKQLCKVSDVAFVSGMWSKCHVMGEGCSCKGSYVLGLDSGYKRG